MQRDLEIDLLRSFAAVAAHTNFTRAGKALGRTQSAVSLQIKRLEGIVGKSLFERDKRSVAITRTGEALLVYANRILAMNDAALSHIHQPKAEGLVRIGAPDDYATYLLPPVLSEFSKAYPRLRFELTCEGTYELLRLLNAEDLDIVLATHPCDKVAGELARHEPLHWVAAPDFVDDSQSPLSLVLYPHPCACRDIALDALRHIERDWHIACSTRSIDLIQKTLIAGSGVSVMEASTIPEGLRIVDGTYGLPPLPDVVIGLHQSVGEARDHVKIASDFILSELGRHDAASRAA